MSDVLDRLGPELAGRVRSELQPGEEALWASRPQRGAPAIFFIICVPLGIIAIIIGLLTLVLLVGVVFLAVGLVFAFLPAIQSGMLRRTAYIVTDRRAIVVEPTMFGYRAIRSFAPSALGAIQRREYTWRGRPMGDLVFAREVVGMSDSARSQEIGFIGIAGAREVEDLIRRMAVAGTVAPALAPG